MYKIYAAILMTLMVCAGCLELVPDIQKKQPRNLPYSINEHPNEEKLGKYSSPGGYIPYPDYDRPRGYPYGYYPCQPNFYPPGSGYYRGSMRPTYSESYDLNYDRSNNDNNPLS